MARRKENKTPKRSFVLLLKARVGAIAPLCVDCQRQFLDCYEIQRGYSDELKRECLKMYVNGMGFRAIARVKGVSHVTVINWVKQVGELLPNAYEPETIPQVGELDELETFIGSKKTNVGSGRGRIRAQCCASHSQMRQHRVNHFRPGILGWAVGDRSAKTFKVLWKIVKTWKCYFYVTDGWNVYPKFIPDGDQIVSKTYMTRVEGENTRLRHCARGAHRRCSATANRHTSIARLHRKTLCYSKSEIMLKHSVRLLIHYLRFKDVPVPYVQKCDFI